MKIIPAINSDSFEEIKKRIKIIEPHVDWVQIDVADGTFTKNTIWHNPHDLALLGTKLKIELHLMIADIDRRIEDWLLPNVGRIVFHISASHDPDFVIEKCKEAGKEVGIAIGPDEPLVKALAYKDKVDVFQILAVHPGLAGQKAMDEAFDRIKEVREACKSCIIEVDGGMNKEIAKRAVEAGANIINAASAIFSQKDIGKAIEELK